MITFYQSTYPIFNPTQIEGIKKLWNQEKQILKEFPDRRYTSYFAENETTYTPILLDWVDSVLGYNINREGCSLILHKFQEGDYFEKHADNVIRRNNLRSYVIGCSLNDNYTGGEYTVYQETPFTIDKTPGMPYLMRADQLHEIKPVTYGIRESLVIFLFQKNTKIKTIL